MHVEPIWMTSRLASSGPLLSHLQFLTFLASSRRTIRACALVENYLARNERVQRSDKRSESTRETKRERSKQDEETR